MKKLILLLVHFGCALFAASPPSEEVQFRIEPSFANGTLIQLNRTRDGKIRCAAYKLPFDPAAGTQNRAKVRPVLLKATDIAAADFQVLVEGMEALRREAATSDPVGIDGSIWVFRRRAGGSVIELSFRSPEFQKGSGAYALAQKFVAVARLEGILPEETDNADIPTVVPGRDFNLPHRPPER